MMRIHLGSIRQFYPEAPILVSKRGDAQEEMESYRLEFGVRSWLEDCSYEGALTRLFERCETEYACVLDHDTILLSSLDPLLDGLRRGHYDVVGIEDRIQVPNHGVWLRYAPGYMDASFLMFNWREFKHRWGLHGVGWEEPPGTAHDEFHYGICQKLKRHKYLLPFHTRKYGIGNLVKDGETPILWHQWYGAYRSRSGHDSAWGSALSERIATVKNGEATFLADYPNLDLADLTPAWGSGLSLSASIARLRRWRSYGWRRFTTLTLARLRKKWKLLLS